MALNKVGSKWFWALTGINVIAFLMFLLLIYAALRALAAFAAGIEETPIFALFGAGFVLSIASLLTTRTKRFLRRRRVAYFVNGAVFSVYGLMLVAVAGIWFSTTRRLFLVPSGFQGDLYVVHARNAHGAAWSFLRKTYRFDRDGTLYTTDPAPRGFSDEYRYVFPDGHTKKLGDAGPGTLPDNAKNRADVGDVVTYFDRSLIPSGPYGCFIEEISIGTRAFLLSRPSRLPSLEQIHPGSCH
jgi:hypothetical protein